MRNYSIFITLAFLYITAAHADDFVLTSTSFANNGRIPSQYTCDKGNVSPELRWTNSPAKTQSFVLTITSPDYLQESIYLWVVFNIPASINELPKGSSNELPMGALEGQNFYYDETNYHGPCPPDELLHHYIYTIYALDTMLNLEDGEETEKIVKEMKGHVLKQAQIIGIYSH